MKVKINSGLKRGQAKRPYYVLNGWYEGEYGLTIVSYIGGSLEDCVRKAINEHPDFGYTDMELDGGYLVADYDVTRAASAMCDYVRSVE